jgi:hypothetical protein
LIGQSGLQLFHINIRRSNRAFNSQCRRSPRGLTLHHAGNRVAGTVVSCQIKRDHSPSNKEIVNSKWDQCPVGNSICPAILHKVARIINEAKTTNLIIELPSRYAIFLG